MAGKGGASSRKAPGESSASVVLRTRLSPGPGAGSARAQTQGWYLSWPGGVATITGTGGGKQGTLSWPGHRKTMLTSAHVI